jgi:hypothetical protein
MAKLLSTIWYYAYCTNKLRYSFLYSAAATTPTTSETADPSSSCTKEAVTEDGSASTTQLNTVTGKEINAQENGKL